jgi:uncharacterized membrane protein
MKRSGMLVFFVAIPFGVLLGLVVPRWDRQSWYMPHMNPFGFWMGGAILVIALVVVLLVLPRTDASSSTMDAKRQLDLRFARGDITEAEYREIRAILKGGGDR